MNPAIVSIIVLALLIIAILVGRQFRQLLPDKRVSEDTKDTDSPFDGIIRIPSRDMMNALNELPK